MPRSYVVEDSIASVTAAATLLALTLPADLIVQVDEASITCSHSTSEALEGALDRATGTAGGGAAVVATPDDFGDVATSVTELSASGAAITGLTPQDELGGTDYAPSVVGWQYKPTDGRGRFYSPSQVIILRTLNTITSATVRVRLKYTEFGG